jgi:hypothetical protein
LMFLQMQMKMPLQMLTLLARPILAAARLSSCCPPLFHANSCFAFARACLIRVTALFLALSINQ